MKELFDLDDGTTNIGAKASESLEDIVTAEYSTAVHSTDRPMELDEHYIVFKIGDSVQRPLLSPYEAISSLEEYDYAIISIEDRQRIRAVYPKPSRAILPAIGEELDVL